jgi:spermidine/putrescine transport system permease protein
MAPSNQASLNNLSNRFARAVMNAYLFVFFGYLFLPLVLMLIAAFNTSVIPSVLPWKGFTLHWFSTLFTDDFMWRAILNSLVIGLGVVVFAVPVGLAAALLLTRLQSRSQPYLYALMVSPILTPGVILGISTLIFWNRIGLEGGLVLTVIGQTTFIASFSMLIFMAQLQRLDPALEEAALDLGASHLQAYRRIVFPYLKTTLMTAAFISFLQSFENYNTTLFVIGADTTLTVKVASMIRLGLTPEVNALSVIFIGLTVLAAVLYTLLRDQQE